MAMVCESITSVQRQTKPANFTDNDNDKHGALVELAPVYSSGIYIRLPHVAPETAVQYMPCLAHAFVGGPTESFIFKYVCLCFFFYCVLVIDGKKARFGRHQINSRKRICTAFLTGGNQNVWFTFCIYQVVFVQMT